MTTTHQTPPEQSDTTEREYQLAGFILGVVIGIAIVFPFARFMF